MSDSKTTIHTILLIHEYNKSVLSDVMVEKHVSSEMFFDVVALDDYKYICYSVTLSEVPGSVFKFRSVEWLWIFKGNTIKWREIFK